MKHKERYLRVKDGLTMATAVPIPVGTTSIPIWATSQQFTPGSGDVTDFITLSIEVDAPKTFLMRGAATAKATSTDAFAMLFFTSDVNLTPSHTYEELNGHPYGVWNPIENASPHLTGVTITGVKDIPDAGVWDMHLGFRGFDLDIVRMKLIVIVGANTGDDSINYVDVIEG